jgi:hypothetical protein
MMGTPRLRKIESEQGFVSVNNSSTATLAGDGVFTGVGEDVSNIRL